MYTYKSIIKYNLKGHVHEKMMGWGNDNLKISFVNCTTYTFVFHNGQPTLGVVHTIFEGNLTSALGTLG